MTSESAPNGVTSASAVEMTDLPLGRPLGLDGAHAITRAQFTPIVLLAGPARSGKTTLIASVHECFQWGPFADYAFAGSRTLLGFEEKCFDSRVSSGALTPSTARTPFQSGQHFFHLRVRKDDLSAGPRDLLLADMSGEYFERAVEAREDVRELGIIRRADHFVLLLDGERLAANATWTDVRAEASLLLRRCLEEAMLGERSRVELLVTKWDIMLRELKDGGAQTRLSLVRDRFTEQFAARFCRFRTTPVAARPAPGSRLQRAFGLAPLFRSWIEEAPTLLIQHGETPPGPNIEKMFDRFGVPPKQQTAIGAK